MHSLKNSPSPLKRPRLTPQPPPTPPNPQTLTTNKPSKWTPLNLTQSELSLPLTFPTGQTFRWKQTGPLQYTGPIGPHLISLKHLQNGDVCYHIHTSPSEPAAKSALLDFLNIGISLGELWEGFSASDCRFAELAKYLAGARVLRQDPVECLLQFLCSSNNNIARITKMVDFLASLGSHLGKVEGFEFHEFPSLERLSLVSEVELRNAGFGYRAKYITGTVDVLQSKHGGGAEWLLSLRKLDLQEIATRYLLPELAGARLTPKLCSRVAEAFVSKYGKYAGWAQTLLFIAELPSQKAILPSDFCAMKENKSAKTKER